MSDGLVLAAVDRAHRHGDEEGRDAPIWSIADHLEIAKRTIAAREVRARLSALEEEDLLRTRRRHGVLVWALTRDGQRRLERELRSSSPPNLPESPQHRAWRNARERAAQEIKHFRDTLETMVAVALEVAAADQPASSDTWFDLAERLHHAAWRLGSATHCLNEWREPSDERADIDTREEPGDLELPEGVRASWRARRVGRRNTTLWREETVSSEPSGSD